MIIQDRKGTILISSLWILAILSILAVGVGFRVSIEARLSKYNMDRTKALYIARAGVYKAGQLLSRDSNEYDYMTECGIFLPGKEEKASELAKLFTKIGVGDGNYSIVYTQEGKDYPGMMDEERRININTASQKALEALLGEENKDIAAAIIDWRDTDEATSAGGAEDDYYETLGYETKDAPFSAAEELFLVKGMTPAIFDSIKEYITIYGPADGKVNINTATERVVRAVCHAAGATGVSDIVVNEIVAKRWGKKDEEAGARPETETIFTDENSIGAILNLDEYDEDLSKLKNSFTTKADYFRIESRGTIDRSKTEKVVAYVVQKDARKGAVLKSYREY